MQDNPADTTASEGGEEGAAGTRAEIPLQTIVQGGADIHLQPMHSDVFSLPVPSRSEKNPKQLKNYIKVIIFLLAVNTEPQVSLCQGSNGLGNQESFICVSGFFFFFPLSSLLYLPHKELELLSGGEK